MAVLEKDIVLQTKDASGNDTIYYPMTKVGNVEGGVASINNILPDDSGNITIDLGEGSAGSIPIGFIFFSVLPATPSGAVEAQGLEISRATYANLFEYAKDSGMYITESEWQEKALNDSSNVPYYSDGDGATTFRVPMLNAYAVMSSIRGSTVEHRGRYCIMAYSNVVNAGSLEVAEVLQGVIDVTARVTSIEAYKRNTIGEARERSSDKYSYGQN